MADIIDLSKKQKQPDAVAPFVAMCLCLECQGTWMGCFAIKVSLFKLRCPHCHKQKSFASVVPREFMVAFMPEKPPQGAA